MIVSIVSDENRIGAGLDGQRIPGRLTESVARMGNRISPGRIPELDGIRAVAILLVVGCHYEGFCSLLGGLPSYGWIGVDVFFVLSGFLITSILIELRGATSPLKVFYIRRVLRIFPIYYLMILFVSAISLACREHMVHFGYYVSRFLFLQSFKDAPALFHRAWTALLNMKTPRALLQRSVLPLAEQGAQLGPWANSLSAAWSLSIEEYFYILWAPIVIFLEDRWKVAVAAGLIFGASVTMQYLGFAGEVDYFDFFCRISTIMAGSMLALFLRWRSRMPSPSQRHADTAAKILAGCLTIPFVAILLWNRPLLGHELRDSVSFMVLGLPIFSVLLALALGWIVQRQGGTFFPLRALRWRPVRYLGTISYSLYLFHAPVYFYMLHCATAFRLSGNLVPFAVSVAALSLSITCSALSWKYLETPILNLKNRWAPTEARVMAGVTAG